MATRMVKIRTEKEETALREKQLERVLGHGDMQRLRELTTDWNQRYTAGGPITPPTMVAILIYMEHDTRFPEKRAQVEQL